MRRGLSTTVIAHGDKLLAAQDMDGFLIYAKRVAPNLDHLALERALTKYIKAERFNRATVIWHALAATYEPLWRSMVKLLAGMLACGLLLFGALGGLYFLVKPG